MKVSKLPRDPGPAAWNRLLPKADPPEPLEENSAADWLIIGAGFAGLAAARRLSILFPKDRITILDAIRVAEGPAGRNSGFMIDLPHDLSSSRYVGALESDRENIADNRAAIDFAEETATAFGLPEEAFGRSGKINAAASSKGVANNRLFAEHLTQLGEAYEVLDAQNMAELTGSGYYQSGLFTPGAAVIQPALFVRGVASGLRSNRVKVHELSPVTALERNGDWVATTPRGTVTAPRVILAVNGVLNNFGFLQGRLMHVLTYASMTRALTYDETVRLGGASDWGVLPADPHGTTVRRVSGNGGHRIVVRNTFTFEPSMSVDDGHVEKIGRVHDRSFEKRFPMLSHVDMQYRWGGRLCLSLNDVQVVRELDDGLITACCQNGLGTVRGTLAGMLAAELAAGVSSPALDRMLSSDAPRKLPPAPLAKFGAKVRLGWAARSAGREL